MAQTIIAEIGNVTIIKDGNKYGLKDKSNLIKEAIKYDSIEEWPIVKGRKILKMVENDKIGFYDAIRADWICFCTLSQIDHYDKVKNVIIGKQPLKILGIHIWQCNVEIEL